VASSSRSAVANETESTIHIVYQLLPARDQKTRSCSSFRNRDLYDRRAQASKANRQPFAFAH